MFFHIIKALFAPFASTLNPADSLGKKYVSTQRQRDYDDFYCLANIFSIDASACRSRRDESGQEVVLESWKTKTLTFSATDWR